MASDTFAAELRALYLRTSQHYAAGQRGTKDCFNASDMGFLAANGLAAQAVFDYVEDDTASGEPGWDKALAIETVRRDYFLTTQEGKVSSRLLEVEQMPAKADTVRGIPWLPRLIVKTKAKLRGELPPVLMYCCGGDRRFFREHDLNPAEFLRFVWRHEHDDEAIVAWVLARRKK